MLGSVVDNVLGILTGCLPYPQNPQVRHASGQPVGST